MRILGIDYGDRRIGLALSDPLLITAQPFAIYILKANDEENRRYFRDLVAAHDIGEIVLGNPLRMDGTAGTRTRKTEEFAAWLEAAVDRPVVLWDERLTTREAVRFLEDRGIRGGKKKGYEDQLAAVIILAAYLERKRGPHAPENP